MERIKCVNVFGQPTFHCDQCEEYLADFFVTKPKWLGYDESTIILALCRSCLTLFREEMKEVFKQIERRYAEERSPRVTSEER